MKAKILIAGSKAHASIVFDSINERDDIEIVGVFTDKEDNFCMLNLMHIGELAKVAGIPCYLPSQLTIETLKSITKDKKGLDLLLLVEWKKLLTESVYNFPQYGSFNIHDSLLPEYRGSSPMNWSIIHGDSHTGATFYQITKSADSGPVYAQEKLEIEKTDYAQDVLRKMLGVYKRVAIQGIRAVIDHKTSQDQDESKASYCAKRTPEDGLVDFHANVQAVYNMVRALTDPFPGAFTFYKGVKVTITKASIVKRKYHYVGNIPGSLLKAEKIWILCGNGILCVEEISANIEGKLIHKPKEFFTDFSVRLPC
jgi:UDP-4-amino-4-deoxy-L-arabinose formyltransferase/UDP-glucuronic acid dehydrogenase (UDP-4-keto-hexauronic acid decarboxylating)